MVQTSSAILFAAVVLGATSTTFAAPVLTPNSALAAAQPPSSVESSKAPVLDTGSKQHLQQQEHQLAMAQHRVNTLETADADVAKGKKLDEEANKYEVDAQELKNPNKLPTSHHLAKGVAGTPQTHGAAHPASNGHPKNSKGSAHGTNNLPPGNALKPVSGAVGGAPQAHGVPHPVSNTPVGSNMGSAPVGKKPRRALNGSPQRLQQQENALPTEQDSVNTLKPADGDVQGKKHDKAEHSKGQDKHLEGHRLPTSHHPAHAAADLAHADGAAHPVSEEHHKYRKGSAHGANNPPHGNALPIHDSGAVGGAPQAHGVPPPVSNTPVKSNMGSASVGNKLRRAFKDSPQLQQQNTPTSQQDSVNTLNTADGDAQGKVLDHPMHLKAQAKQPEVQKRPTSHRPAHAAADLAHADGAAHPVSKEHHKHSKGSAHDANKFPHGNALPVDKVPKEKNHVGIKNLKASPKSLAVKSSVGSQVPASAPAPRDFEEREFEEREFDEMMEMFERGDLDFEDVFGRSFENLEELD